MDDRQILIDTFGFHGHRCWASAARGAGGAGRPAPAGCRPGGRQGPPRRRRDRRPPRGQFRDLPDGSSFVPEVLTSPGCNPKTPELPTEYLREVGIKVKITSLDQTAAQNSATDGRYDTAVLEYGLSSADGDAATAALAEAAEARAAGRVAETFAPSADTSGAGRPDPERIGVAPGRATTPYLSTTQGQPLSSREDAPTGTGTFSGAPISIHSARAAMAHAACDSPAMSRRDRMRRSARETAGS